MFTDTKNLANLTVNTTNAAAKQINTHPQDDDKFKLKKMWKPIIRLMSRKSALARNGKRDNNSSSMPNNLYLNNASQYASINNKDETLSSTSSSSSSALVEDSSYATHKLPLAEFWQNQQQQQEQYQTSHQQQRQQQQETSTQTLEFISKASIDKTPLDTCTNCVYGRNCQHSEFHQIESLYANVNSQSHTHSQSHPNPQPCPQLHPHPHFLQNFNYFDAEDGCFVWSDNSADMDENALREWLWQNSWQFTENPTIC